MRSWQPPHHGLLPPAFDRAPPGEDYALPRPDCRFSHLASCPWRTLAAPGRLVCDSSCDAVRDAVGPRRSRHFPHHLRNRLQAPAQLTPSDPPPVITHARGQCVRPYVTLSARLLCVTAVCVNSHLRPGLRAAVTPRPHPLAAQ